MRKRERQLVTIGLIVLFGIIAWWAYAKPNIGGFVDLSDLLNKNQTNDNSTTVYKLAIKDLQASVLENGNVEVTFKLLNEEHFNISKVQVLYALNVADSQNANYTEVDATKDNETYKATIPAQFGDIVYYKIKVLYDGNKTLESDVQSITVSDTVAPVISNVTVNYNATTGNATFTITASDNDAIDKIILFYAITPDGNATSFSNITLSTSPYEITLTIDGNTTDTTYYYVNFYVEAYDLSGNSVRLPTNGTFEFYANETTNLVFQEG
uniref:Uncharacterized protein n=1 Tax=Pyrococcus abyssi TaxID=29292 RepID=A0A5J6XTD6_PYRAY|nr:hypothetical protein [Pyrococcus abyssi]QFN51294.1 hypothetical protein [Pyrococcus abyssi]